MIVLSWVPVERKKQMNYTEVELKSKPVRRQRVKLISCIAGLREQANMTQRELADYVDVSESTIANWETGRRGLELFHRLIKLCRALKCTPEDLINYALVADGDEKPKEAVPFSKILELMETNPADQDVNNKSLRDEVLSIPKDNQSTKP